MSFEARFELPTYDDEPDCTNCTNCPYRWGVCANAGRCLQEDYE